MAFTSETKDLALGFYRAIGTDLSLRLARAVEQNQWDFVASCKVDPRAYTDAQEYFLDASAASLLRKCKALPGSSPMSRRREALSTWWEGEQACKRTNARLIPYIEGFSHPDMNVDVMRHIVAIKRKISNVLGRAPRYEDLLPKHGPGATFSDKSVRSTLADKMQSSPSRTPSTTWFLFDWIGTAWGREALSRGVVPTVVRGNRFATAPKDAIKDRPIGAEPSINVFYQLGLGQALRCRLKKKAGIDLSIAKSTHMRLACEASSTGALATEDLKNASGTVAYNLVRLLLPPDWFRLCSELRSPCTRFDARDLSLLLGRKISADQSWYHLEQFSSMGNGFTFELETLIFWAIVSHAVSVCDFENLETRVWVLGDDIIYDRRCSRAVRGALRFFGFTINEEKSFVDGPFRESCGGDFWNGRPVRPVFLKEPLNEPQHFIAAANQIRKLAHDLFGSFGPLLPIWSALLHKIPSHIRRCRGPEWLGDIVIHDLEDSWRTSKSGHIRCYRPVRHRKVALDGRFSPGVIHACGLYGVRVSEGFISPRDSVTGYAVRPILPYGIDWLPTSQLRYWDVDSPPTPMVPLRKGPSPAAYRVPRGTLIAGLSGAFSG